MSRVSVVNKKAVAFGTVDGSDDVKKNVAEILKIKPKVEITIEGSDELATARIVGWEHARKFFIVEWIQKSDTFEKHLESQSGLRAFFKVNLFSKQVVFKSTTLRRMSDGTYHYRVPEQFFAQHRRGALRIPLDPAKKSALVFGSENVLILDLSATGARLDLAHASPALVKKLQLGTTHTVQFSIPALRDLKNINVSIRIVNLIQKQDEIVAGCSFLNLTLFARDSLKHFLLHSLHVYFEGSMK